MTLAEPSEILEWHNESPGNHLVSLIFHRPRSWTHWLHLLGVLIANRSSLRFLSIEAHPGNEIEDPFHHVEEDSAPLSELIAEQVGKIPSPLLPNLTTFILRNHNGPEDLFRQFQELLDYTKLQKVGLYNCPSIGAGITLATALELSLKELFIDSHCTSDVFDGLLFSMSPVLSTLYYVQHEEARYPSGDAILYHKGSLRKLWLEIYDGRNNLHPIGFGYSPGTDDESDIDGAEICWLDITCLELEEFCSALDDEILNELPNRTAVSLYP